MATIKRQVSVFHPFMPKWSSNHTPYEKAAVAHQIKRMPCFQKHPFVI